MIEWCLCDTASATASWASVDLDEFLEQTASGNRFGQDSSWAGGWAGSKRQPAWCSRKTKVKFAIAYCSNFHGKDVSAPLQGRACTGECQNFAESVVCIQTGVLSTMHVQGEVHGLGYPAFPHKLRTGPWQLFGGTSTHPSLPLDETAPNNLVTWTPSILKLCISKNSVFQDQDIFPKNLQTIIKKKLAGLRPAPTLNTCFLHQLIHLRTRSLQDVHMRSCMCSLLI